MRLIFAVMLLMSFNSFAKSGHGKIVGVLGKSDSILTREDKKISIKKNLVTELNDKIQTNNASVTVALHPKNELIINNNSEVKFADKDVLDFIKGAIWLSLKDEMKVQAEGVSFTAKNAEFEVSEGKDSIDLDVIRGEVTVSSPYVQTFVPEIVKAREGFSFGKTKKSFNRRKLSLKIK